MGHAEAGEGVLTQYLTAEEACAILRIPNKKALHAFLSRRRKAGKPITTYRRSGRLHFKQADLDRCFTKEGR